MSASFSYRMLGDMVARNERTRPQLRFTRFSDQARILGAERTAIAQTVQVLEREPLLSAQALALALGCSLRTLQRQLAQEGTSAASVRRAVRLLRATEQVLWTERSLGAIAVDEGFSDLAHMARAFRTSCAVPPGLLRRMARRSRAEQLSAVNVVRTSTAHPCTP
jgi:transcriptional regulator GlxA family with amidase domain